MVPAHQPRVPRLIVVAGYPAAGKSTLARNLSERLQLPLLTKDRIKEALFDVLGVGDRDWSKRLGAAAIRVLSAEAEAVLAAGCSLIIEANFNAALATPDLGGVVDRTGAYPMVVVVEAPAEEIIRRYRRRAHSGYRHPGHLDELVVDELEEMVREPYEPPDLGGALHHIDPTDLIAFDLLAEALEVGAPDPAQDRPAQEPR